VHCDFKNNQINIFFMEAYITSHIGIIILILIWNSPRPFYCLYHYSGVRLVVEKIFPPSNAVLNADEYVKPSSFVPWAISVYFIIFGIASNRYERATSSYEMQIATFQTQMATGYRHIACANLHNIQENKVPHNTDLLRFWHTFYSLFYNEHYKTGQRMLVSTIETYKNTLRECNLSLANLSGADLFKADLESANLTGANLVGTFLANAFLSRVNLSRADLSGALISGADFSRARLLEANLSRAYLVDAFFENADLSRADLSGGNLLETYFRRANLTGADLTGADLTGAKLTGADLTGAKLTGAKLTGADFTRTKLKNVNLADSKNLYKAKIPARIEKELRKTHPHLFIKPDWYHEKFWKYEAPYEN